MASAPKRTHRYVYWHARVDWQVYIGDEFLGIFAKHDEALAKVVDNTGLSQDDLALCADGVRRSLLGQRNAVLMHATWFQHLYKAYATPEGGGPIQVTCVTCVTEQRKARLAWPILTSSYQ